MLDYNIIVIPFEVSSNDIEVNSNNVVIQIDEKSQLFSWGVDAEETEDVSGTTYIKKQGWSIGEGHGKPILWPDGNG